MAALQQRLADLELESADEAEAERPRQHPAQNTQVPVTPNVFHDANGRPWKRDDRVRITISGPYKGREGRLTDRRKKTYWNILLDPLPGQHRGDLIYKKPTSFERC